MTINSLSNVNAPLPPTSTSTGSASDSTSSTTPPVDQTAISPLGRLQTLLQQVQQNRSARFTDITAQIADKLTSAAAKAEQNGNTKAADQLNKLAGEFQKASESGQPPALWELRHPVAALHHYHQTNGQEAASPDVVQTVVDAATSSGLS
ncbi:MAG: hypothetical protein C5B51_23950 [Terriglobia bacterium]|nr:MAG: hypothetical protein C5B51_23950 [Terriglobia bacterium]